MELQVGSSPTGHSIVGRRFDEVRPAGDLRGHVDIPEIDRPAPDSAAGTIKAGMEEGRSDTTGGLDFYA